MRNVGGRAMLGDPTVSSLFLITFLYYLLQGKMSEHTMFPSVMLRSLFAVLILTAVMSYAVYQDYFPGVKVDLGTEHYAEVTLPALKQKLPKWVKMPFNTVVNIGYVLFGAAWAGYSSAAFADKQIRETDTLFFYVFNFLACCYGPIQLLRILTQLYAFAVLDQWYTLPFFMWVLVWGLYFDKGWSQFRALGLGMLSVASYCLTLFHSEGFEICLGIHILLAIYGAVIAWRKFPSSKVGPAFIGAVISCSGFVILKLLDHELVKYHRIFQYVSGHFLSKIFDIFQIHFVNKYFLTITLAAIADQKKKKE